MSYQSGVSDSMYLAGASSSILEFWSLKERSLSISEYWGKYYILGYGISSSDILYKLSRKISLFIRTPLLILTYWGPRRALLSIPKYWGLEEALLSIPKYWGLGGVLLLILEYLGLGKALLLIPEY